MQDGGVQSITRAATLLRMLARHPGGIALAELAAAVELPKSTVHRIVAALAAEEFVATDGGRSRLGPALAQLGAASRETLRHEIRPVLEQLHAELQETVDLAVLDGSSARFIDQLPAAHRLRAVSAVGLRFPLHCTANGKAMLAALTGDDAISRLPARLPRMTANTITSRSALAAELERVRQQGVGFDHEEHTEGICAVGAAVFDRAGLAGAISVPVPTPRFRGRECRYADAIREAARAASQLAGG